MARKRSTTSSPPGEISVKRPRMEETAQIDGNHMNTDSDRILEELNDESEGPITLFPFKELPGELRNKVYHIVNGPQSTLYVEGPEWKVLIGGHPFRHYTLLVDRQLNSEFSSFMKEHGQLTFQIGSRQNDAKCSKCETCRTNHQFDKLRGVTQALYSRYHHVYVELVVDSRMSSKESTWLYRDLMGFLFRYGDTFTASVPCKDCRTILDMGLVFQTHAEAGYFQVRYQWDYDQKYLNSYLGSKLPER